jgi:hypothetical protein
MAEMIDGEREIHDHDRVEVHGDHVHHEQIVKDVELRGNSAAYRVSQLIWLFFGAVIGLIGLRVILQLLAANQGNPFASFILNLSQLFLWPFANLTTNPSFNGAVLEITSIIAMFVYALVGWLIVRLVWLLFYREPTRTVRTYERDEID